MSYAARLAACAVASVLGHALIVQGAKLLPEDKPEKPEKVSVRVIEVPPPQPKPEIEERPVLPEDPVEPEIQPRPRPKRVSKRPPPKHAEPPPRQTEPPPSTSPTPAAEQSDTPQPVFGISMSSTSQASSGPAMAVGDPGASGPATSAPSKGPVTAEKASGPGVIEAHQVSKMPLPIGRCVGTYTDEAREAAIEGTVILDVVVGPDGKPERIKVVRGLPHGLTQAAIKALRRCRFTPGEKDGHAVAVRVRAFKIRFVLREGL